MTAPSLDFSTTMLPALAELAEAISHAPDASGAQARVVETAVALLRAEGGSVMLPDPATGGLRVAASIGLPAWDDAPPGGGVAEWVLRHNEAVLLMGREGPLANLLRREDVRDAVCVPLRYDGEAIGALSVRNSHRRRPFQEEDVKALTAIGRLAAVALRNAALNDEVSEQRERLKEMLRRLWTAQEDERRELASDLHDGPAQTLALVAFRLQTAQGQLQRDPEAARGALEQAEAAVRDTLRQVRAMMAGLRPIALDGLGLVSALRDECEAVTSRGALRATLRVHGEERRPDTEREMALYRAAREALSNVERHAGAEHASVTLEFGPETLTLTVADDGRGLPVDAEMAARRAGRMGLATMRERLSALGGRMEMHSAATGGARIVLTCPYVGGDSPARGGNIL